MIHPSTHRRSANQISDMASSSPEDAGGHLQHALEVYLEEIEAYGRVDRQSFLSRFPDLASELASHLEGIDLMLQIGPGEPQCIKPLATLGDFRIVREIGRGGMGVVYEAEQLSLGRTVALKVLNPQPTSSPEFVERFYREARTAAKLDQLHIVTIYEVGENVGEHLCWPNNTFVLVCNYCVNR